MKNISIISVLVLSFFSPKEPTRPYSCFEPLIHQLIPFTEDELSIFKIRECRKVVEFYDDSNYTKYDFNGLGELISSEEHNSIGGKDSIVGGSIFKYDSTGRLVLKKEWTLGFGKSFDSVVYNENGQMIQYDAYYDNYYEGVWEREDYFKLRPLNITKNKSTLINYSELDSGTIYDFDLNNQMMKSYNPYSRDSIFRNSEKKEYWFKNKSSNGYKKGRRLDYTNSMIKVDTTFEMYSKNSLVNQVKIYEYKDNKLMRVHGFWYNEDKTIYTYNDSGLIHERIRMNKYGCDRIYFKYYY